MNFKTIFLALSVLASYSHAAKVTIKPYNQTTDEKAIAQFISAIHDRDDSIMNPHEAIAMFNTQRAHNGDKIASHVMRMKNDILAVMISGTNERTQITNFKMCVVELLNEKALPIITKSAIEYLKTDSKTAGIVFMALFDFSIEKFTKNEYEQYKIECISVFDKLGLKWVNGDMYAVWLDLKLSKSIQASLKSESEKLIVQKIIDEWINAKPISADYFPNYDEEITAD